MYKIILNIDSNSTMILKNDHIKMDKNRPKILEFDVPQKFEFDIFNCSCVCMGLHINVEFDANNCYVNNSYAKVIKIDNETYILKISVKNIKNMQKKCKKAVKNGIFFNFYQNGLVELENQTSLLFSERFNFLILDADVLELKNGFYCLKFFGENEEEMSVVIDGNFASVLSFDSVIVEPTESGFKVLTDMHDIACHGFVEVYEIDEIAKKVDEYSVYLKGTPQNHFNKNVLPIYFLQCIKASDFSEARRCLSQDLSNRAKNQHLKAYFGNFLDIITFNEKIYIVYQSDIQGEGNNNYFAKEVVFKIKDEKIAEIS